MNKYLLPFYFMLSFSQSLIAAEDDDFWLMLDLPKESNFYLNSAIDTDDNIVLNIQLKQKLNAQYYLNSSWSQLNISQKLDSWSLGLNGDPYRDWNWFYNYLHWGDSNTIKSHDNELRLQKYFAQWSVMLGLQQGNIDIRFSRQLRNGTRSASINHSAILLGLGFNSSTFYWQLEWLQHSYSRDLSQLSNSRRLASIIEPTALQQSSALAQQETTVSLGWIINKTTLSAQLNRFLSAVDQTQSDFLSLSIQYSLSGKLVGLHINRPLSNAPASMGLSLSLQW